MGKCAAEAEQKDEASSLMRPLIDDNAQKCGLSDGACRLSHSGIVAFCSTLPAGMCVGCVFGLAHLDFGQVSDRGW